MHKAKEVRTKLEFGRWELSVTLRRRTLIESLPPLGSWPSPNIGTPSSKYYARLGPKCEHSQWLVVDGIFICQSCRAPLPIGQDLSPNSKIGTKRG